MSKKALEQLQKCQEIAPYLSIAEIINSTGRELYDYKSDDELYEDLVQHEMFLKEFSVLREKNDFTPKELKNGDRVLVILNKPYPSRQITGGEEVKELSGLTGTVVEANEYNEPLENDPLVLVDLDSLPEGYEWRSKQIEEFNTNLVKL